jgi:hypothetical protein
VLERKLIGFAAVEEIMRRCLLTTCVAVVTAVVLAHPRSRHPARQQGRWSQLASQPGAARLAKSTKNHVSERIYFLPGALQSGPARKLTTTLLTLDPFDYWYEKWTNLGGTMSWVNAIRQRKFSLGAQLVNI